MTDNIKKSFKQKSKLTKIFYKHSQRNSVYIKVLEKSEECMRIISEAKKNYFLKMISKLEDSNATWKFENENFQNKIEKVQYWACLATTGAIQGTSREKIYDKLGLHSLAKWCWWS